MIRPPLLEQIRGLIDRSYDHSTGFLGPVEQYVLGDDGYRRLLADCRVVEQVGSGADGARLLIRPDPAGRLRVSLYYPDRLIATLERHDPSRGLHAGNIDAFATFVEELDHLLLLASRARSGPPLTLLEMELHANVTKELVVRHYLARLRRRGRAAVAWARYHLFEKHRFSDPDLAVRQRYEDATRYAVRYLHHLDALPPHRRVRALRRFTRMSQSQKLSTIRHAA